MPHPAVQERPRLLSRTRRALPTLLTVALVIMIGEIVVLVRTLGTPHTAASVHGGARSIAAGSSQATSVSALGQPVASGSTPLPAAGTPQAAPVRTETPALSASLAMAGAGGPAEAVESFYNLVEQHRFGSAAQLWSARMQALYPPGEN